MVFKKPQKGIAQCTPEDVKFNHQLNIAKLGNHK